MYQFFSSEVFGLPADTANLIATIVLALLALFILYMIYRMISRPRMASGRRSRHARLAITDAASVDDRRKLVLVRRDDVEHLIMIGGSNDMVIEADIKKTLAASPAEMSSRPVAPAAPAMPPAPAATAAPATRVEPAAAGVAPTAKPVAPKIEPAAPASAKTPAANPTPAEKPASSLTMPTLGTAAAGAAAVTSSAASSVKETVTAAVEPVTDKIGTKATEVKTTISEDMDALLSEITTEK